MSQQNEPFRSESRRIPSAFTGDPDARAMIGSREHIMLAVGRMGTLREPPPRSGDLRHAMLTRALEAADGWPQPTIALRAQLRASVTAYVRQLRTQGVPPERMLVLVKAAVLDATPPVDGHDARALMELVVRWSIEAYYQAA